MVAGVLMNKIYSGVLCEGVQVVFLKYMELLDGPGLCGKRCS